MIGRPVSTRESRQRARLRTIAEQASEIVIDLQHPAPLPENYAPPILSYPLPRRATLRPLDHKPHRIESIDRTITHMNARMFLGTSYDFITSSMIRAEINERLVTVLRAMLAKMPEDHEHASRILRELRYRNPIGRGSGKVRIVYLRLPHVDWLVEQLDAIDAQIPSGPGKRIVRTTRAHIIEHVDHEMNRIVANNS